MLAPEESVTWPDIKALNSCAQASALQSMTNVVKRKRILLLTRRDPGIPDTQFIYRFGSEHNGGRSRPACVAPRKTQKGAGFRRRLFLVLEELLLLHRSGLQLLALFFEHRAAAEFDFVAFERQALDQDLVAFLQLVANVLNAILGDLADVQQTVGSREDFHESAEIHQAHHFAEIRLADFGGGGEIADDLDRLVRAGFIGAGHVNRAIVFDVDLDAGLFDDAADDFAAWSDHVANLVGRNVQGVDPRCVLADRRPGGGQRLVHLVEDVQAALARLRQRFLHDIHGDVRHLDIHLETGDSGARAGNFEIHVAVVVFGARDVGEDGVVLAFQHQAHGNTADVSRQRSARIHQGQRSAADRGLRARTVGFEDVANHAHGVGELIFAGDQRGERTLGESAVADFAAARSTHEAGFADAERREVVVQHEALAGFARFQEFDALRIELLEPGEASKRFMLHYNFPPFSVGETGFMRGPGRREIGHGALAERSLTALIPGEDKFPYTMRVVSDILESNGSSSQATVCGASLALMDAGAPLPAHVGGIAMG